GQVPVEGDPSAPFSSWTGATALWIGALAVATGAYIAAVFLAADAVRADAPDLATAFRRRALGSAAVAGLMAIGGLFVIRADARDLYDGLTSGGGLAMVVVSAAVGLLTVWLLWASRFELARYTSGIAVGAMLAGLAFALRPDFLPGELSLRDAAAGDATLIATLVVLVIALLVIVPAVAVLFRLAVQGRLSESLQPIVAPEDRRGR
ncbi:MAG TPA: cytochrome d ubiquinol oxidase subunit II, partial [Thermoleophilaceae bacterium]|nr:cytochrome d ubiquinol oxidase subunit II [Thermoleophilaceae bacterium]